MEFTVTVSAKVTYFNKAYAAENENSFKNDDNTYQNNYTIPKSHQLDFNENGDDNTKDKKLKYNHASRARFDDNIM